MEIAAPMMLPMAREERPRVRDARMTASFVPVQRQQLPRRLMGYGKIGKLNLFPFSARCDQPNDGFRDPCSAGNDSGVVDELVSAKLEQKQGGDEGGNVVCNHAGVRHGSGDNTWGCRSVWKTLRRMGGGSLRLPRTWLTCGVARGRSDGTGASGIATARTPQRCTQETDAPCFPQMHRGIEGELQRYY